MDGAKPADTTGTKKHFGLDQARAVKEDFMAREREERLTTNFPDIDIDLSCYSSASIEALDHLAPLAGAFAFIGFPFISPEMAKALSEWATYGLMFERVESLCLISAAYLGSEQRGHLIDFQGPIRLDASAAKALACNDTLLILRLQSAPTRSLAHALAGHRHELTLHLPCDIPYPEVARALSSHAGYHLDLWLPNRPSESVLQQFASNPDKHFRISSPDQLNAYYKTTHHENWLISLSEDLDVWRARASGAE